MLLSGLQCFSISLGMVKLEDASERCCFFVGPPRYSCVLGFGVVLPTSYIRSPGSVLTYFPAPVPTARVPIPVIWAFLVGLT